MMKQRMSPTGKGLTRSEAHTVGMVAITATTNWARRPIDDLYEIASLATGGVADRDEIKTDVMALHREMQRKRVISDKEYQQAAAMALGGMIRFSARIDSAPRSSGQDHETMARIRRAAELSEQAAHFLNKAFEGHGPLNHREAFAFAAQAAESIYGIYRDMGLIYQRSASISLMGEFPRRLVRVPSNVITPRVIAAAPGVISASDATTLLTARRARGSQAAQVSLRENLFRLSAEERPLATPVYAPDPRRHDRSIVSGWEVHEPSPERVLECVGRLLSAIRDLAAGISRRQGDAVSPAEKTAWREMDRLCVNALGVMIRHREDGMPLGDLPARFSRIVSGVRNGAENFGRKTPAWLSVLDDAEVVDRIIPMACREPEPVIDHDNDENENGGPDV